MKTAGQLLREKRLEKELSIEDIASKLKVRPEYLIAVENNDYQKLPSSTSAKGFLRNYARVLYLNPDTILAMFRRDFAEDKEGKIIPKGALDPISKKPRFFSATYFFIGLSIFVFCGFLFWQLLSWRSLPKLEVSTPVSGEVYTGKVIVRGVTNKDAVITVNNQKVLVDQNGYFSLELVFPKGTHSLLIKAESRAGKVRLVERTFQIID